VIVRFLVLAISIITTTPCFAEANASLPQLKGFSPFVLEKMGDYISECGQSKIRVKGVDSFNGNSFSFIDINSAEIQISVHEKKSLILGSFYLNDFNGIACVNKGKQIILIWGNCGGSLCVDRSDVFYIINSSNLKFIQPKNPKKFICDEKCAERVVGREIVEQINNW
jgi:hypothetical protein